MGLIKDDAHVKTVCKPGHGAETCRYLAVDALGWDCLKLTSYKNYLDNRVASDTMVAKGDNCPGR